MLVFLKRFRVFLLVGAFTVWAPRFMAAQAVGASDDKPAGDGANPSTTVVSLPASNDQPILRADAEPAADPQAPAASPGTVPPLASRPGFFTRWGQAYVADWHGNPPGTDPKFLSPRRGTPPPIFSPPFPSTDWPIGGTPLIGAPDTQTYVFMQAVNEEQESREMVWLGCGWRQWLIEQQRQCIQGCSGKLALRL